MPKNYNVKKAGNKPLPAWLKSKSPVALKKYFKDHPNSIYNPKTKLTKAKTPSTKIKSKVGTKDPILKGYIDSQLKNTINKMLNPTLSKKKITELRDKVKRLKKLRFKKF